MVPTGSGRFFHFASKMSATVPMQLMPTVNVDRNLMSPTGEAKHRKMPSGNFIMLPSTSSSQCYSRQHSSSMDYSKNTPMISSSPLFQPTSPIQQSSPISGSPRSHPSLKRAQTCHASSGTTPCPSGTTPRSNTPLLPSAIELALSDNQLVRVQNTLASLKLSGTLTEDQVNAFWNTFLSF